MGSIRAISGRRELAKALADIRSRLYDKLPGWHAPPDWMELERFDPDEEPFWKTHFGQTFIHEEGRTVVARVTVFLPNAPTTTGRFGLFDSIDDEAVSGPLLDMASRWLAARGVTRVEGPYFFNIHEEVGLLTRGFERPSAILMPFNPEHYAKLLTAAGFVPARRFLSYRYDLATSYERVTQGARAIGKYALRPFDLKHIRQEADTLMEVYNSAFQQNWGFQPLTPEEGDTLVETLLKIGDPALVRIAEAEGRPVGFILCVPDINGYLHSIRRYPEVAKKLALGWAIFRRAIRDCRVITLAVRREFQGRALSKLLIDDLASAARARGYRNAELSYVDTENRQMRRLMNEYDFKSDKEYQLFERDLLGES